MGEELAGFIEKLHNLRRYALMNTLAIIKITKKHDKHSSEQIQPTVLASLNGRPFFDSPRFPALVESVETLASSFAFIQPLANGPCIAAPMLVASPLSADSAPLHSISAMLRHAGGDSPAAHHPPLPAGPPGPALYHPHQQPAAWAQTNPLSLMPPYMGAAHPLHGPAGAHHHHTGHHHPPAGGPFGFFAPGRYGMAAPAHHSTAAAAAAAGGADGGGLPPPAGLHRNGGAESAAVRGGLRERHRVGWGAFAVSETPPPPPPRPPNPLLQSNIRSRGGGNIACRFFYWILTLVKIRAPHSASSAPIILTMSFG